MLVRTGQVRLISRNVPTVGGTKYSQVAVTEDDLPTATEYGQAFLGDLRSVSGLGLGDGIKTHTKKWMDVRPVVFRSYWAELGDGRAVCCAGFVGEQGRVRAG